jgi:predicted nucleotidyltransferase
VLEETILRAAAVDVIDGVIVIGSFADGEPDALSDLDLIAVTAPDRLDDAWAARRLLASDAIVTWESRASSDAQIRWFKWLTRDLVKVECGIATPGSKELAPPFAVVLGPPSLADAFPRIDMATVKERAAQVRQQQRIFDPDDMTPGERVDWKLSELKNAVRDAQRDETK